MRRKSVQRAAGFLGAAVITLVAASCGSDSTGPAAKIFVANLVAANEVPPKTTTGTGTATFVDNGAVINWTLSLTNMTAVTASHIHLGAAIALGVAHLPPETLAFNRGYTQDAELCQSARYGLKPVGLDHSFNHLHEETSALVNPIAQKAG